MSAKNSHCSWCGHPYGDNTDWPRVCANCGQACYRNPLPVAVLLVPVDGGLLTVRRDIEPGRGKLALPGGFIDFGESWQQAAAREVAEETGTVVAPDDIRLYDVLSAPDGTVLVFGICSPVDRNAIPPSAPNAETMGWELLTGPTNLAFPLHTQVVQRFFAG